MRVNHDLGNTVPQGISAQGGPRPQIMGWDGKVERNDQKHSMIIQSNLDGAGLKGAYPGSVTGAEK